MVDISGSMKKNDPANLRVPAIKLLSNLLPSNSRAGIWTFGQYVNELVPLAPVSPRWQQQAVAKADEIGSTGMFTNIGTALQRASAGWQGKPAEARHVILLTDGVVDVSKQAADNVAARSELLHTILPAIKNTGAKIHTIALSAEADAALLEQLARSTDGLFERAASADDLNRIFLRLFEQAAPRDALPLFDNGFLVDGSVDEITVLVFRKAGAEPAALMAPDGNRHSAASHPAEWRWHSEAHYDLITVAKPAQGQWQIQAELDPDNRVLVVSKMGLDVAAVPTLALAGEKLGFKLELTEDGAPIQRADFLKLVKATVTAQAGDGYQRELELAPAGNGLFASDWEVPALDTSFQLTVMASAPTFQRLRKFTLQAVATPVEAAVAVDDHGVANVEFTVRANLFKPDSISFRAQRLLPDGSQQPVTLTGSALAWQATVDKGSDGQQQLQWQFDALTVAGRPISMQGAPLTWQTGDGALAPAPVAEAAPATETPATTEPEPAPVKPEVEPEPAKTPKETGIPWLVIAIAVNSVLIGIGAAFWWVRRRHKQAASKIDNALADAEDAPP